MLQIYYLHCKDIEGKKRTYESFDYEELIPVNSEKPTGGLFLLGEWICDFLSLPTDQVKLFLDQYDFSDAFKNDYSYPYHIFNHYLNTTPFRSLSTFQDFMASNHLAMPPYSFEKDQNDNIKEIFNCNSMIELCTVQMYQIFKQNRTINLCVHCGRWFVPKNKTDEKYCLRPSPRYPDKTCRDAAKLVRVLDSRHSNEATRLLKNLRQMYYTNGKIPDELNKMNNVWKSRLKAGEVTQDQYIEWLKSNYKKKFK